MRFAATELSSSAAILSRDIRESREHFLSDFCPDFGCFSPCGTTLGAAEFTVVKLTEAYENQRFS
jgi:hypothetical protein